MRKNILLYSAFGVVVIVVAASAPFLIAAISSHQQEPDKATKNVSLGELANSIKPIYPEITVVQGKLQDSIDGVPLTEIAKNTISDSIVRDQKVGISKGIEKEGQAEIALFMGSDNARDGKDGNLIVAVTLTNTGTDKFYLKQFAIGGQTSPTGIAPLTATILDSDYSPEVWGSLPKPAMTELVTMNPGDSISAYITGKYVEQFTGQPVTIFGGSAGYYYEPNAEDYNNGFGWGISVSGSTFTNHQ